MPAPLPERFHRQLPGRNPADPNYVPELVDAILDSARDALASDVHLSPRESVVEMRWRIDGVLQPIAEFPRELGPKIVGRLKVLSDLLTYRTEVPQEGRLRGGESDVETRVSTFPTLYGEKAVIRLFIGSGRYRFLDDLGLPADALSELRRLLGETGGGILIAGPAGSGKTTTIYACLREIVSKSRGGRSLASLEDPIEVVIEGVDQSQVNPGAGFDMHTGLRSLLRQDPEVMMVGEIRDRTTAETVFQASLTGHLVLTTFHAGSAARALSRLSDMGIEPYLLRSGLLAVLCLRLLRRLCRCAAPNENPTARLGLAVERVHTPVGCDECGGTGYSGRMVLAELLLPDAGELGAAILARDDAARLEELAAGARMINHWQRACQAIEAGLTSAEEAVRVLGIPPRAARAEERA
jgi:type II secretory ATPase GspE/PulE/Tfp pilus assembly ATPase PilB-like protein